MRSLTNWLLVVICTSYVGYMIAIYCHAVNFAVGCVAVYLLACFTGLLRAIHFKYEGRPLSRAARKLLRVFAWGCVYAIHGLSKAGWGAFNLCKKLERK
jgi:hypothetical protein